MTDDLCETCIYSTVDAIYDDDKGNECWIIHGCELKGASPCTECEFYKEDKFLKRNRVNK